MIKVTLKTKGNPNLITKDLSDLKNFKIPSAVEKIGEEVKKRFRDEIKPNRNGSTGKLANSINVEKDRTSNEISVGIGNIQVMSKIAPYWSVLNSGITIKNQKFIPGMGKFAPLGSFEGSAPDKSMVGRGKQAWNKPGQYSFLPKTYKPIYYIDKTIGWLDVYFDQYFSKI